MPVYKHQIECVWMCAKVCDHNTISIHSSLRKYFKWIFSIEDVLQAWHDKLTDMNVNYDDISTYSSNCSFLLYLSKKLRIKSQLCNGEEIGVLKSIFLTQFELLNCHLLRYISQLYDDKWCSLPILLSECGVILPENLESSIQRCVVFPNDKSDNCENLLNCSLQASVNGKFKPGPGVGISLKLTKDCSLRDLSALVQGLEEFQQPLNTSLDMLIFFKLNRSIMFDKYLKLQITRVYEETCMIDFVNMSQSSMVSSAAQLLSPVSNSLPSLAEEQPISVFTLCKSLELTHELLQKIMDGVAVYSDIIAEGEIDLEKIDVVQEFTTVKLYFTTICHFCSNFEGLFAVQNLLELFQYTKDVHIIYNVCEQYHLDGCLQDPHLQELNELVCNLDSDGYRANLTPKFACEKMKRVLELLCVSADASSHCFRIFAAIADSAEFYKFVQEKHFYGENGQTVFHQQYHLITNQLQHEDYDESVLNHLPAAFKVITPFLDRNQTFHQLMTQVTSLDITVPIRLETVNMNITVIRHWFSRAEVN